MTAPERRGLAQRVLPLALVVRPKLHEASALAGLPVETEEDMVIILGR